MAGSRQADREGARAGPTPSLRLCDKALGRPCTTPAPTRTGQRLEVGRDFDCGPALAGTVPCPRPASLSLFKTSESLVHGKRLLSPLAQELQGRRARRNGGAPSGLFGTQTTRQLCGLALAAMSREDTETPTCHHCLVSSLAPAPAGAARCSSRRGQSAWGGTRTHSLGSCWEATWTRGPPLCLSFHIGV